MTFRIRTRTTSPGLSTSEILLGGSVHLPTPLGRAQVIEEKAIWAVRPTRSISAFFPALSTARTYPASRTPSFKGLKPTPV